MSGEWHMSRKELLELIDHLEESNSGSLQLAELKEFYASLPPDPTDKPKQRAVNFLDENWDLVKVYEFKKRTTYIYCNKLTGEEKAHDILK